VYDSVIVFPGSQSLYLCFGVQELHLVKNLTPSRAFAVRKRVRARFAKWREGLFIDYRAPQFTELTKCKNDDDCRRSRNARTPCLRCWLNEMILVLSFLSLGKVQSISAPVVQTHPCVGFTTTLSLRLQFPFASLSCLSMLSFHSGRTAGSRLLSSILVPASFLTQLRWGCIWPLLLFWHCGA
jgi:hypothetical protein